MRDLRGAVDGSVLAARTEFDDLEAMLLEQLLQALWQSEQRGAVGQVELFKLGAPMQSRQRAQRRAAGEIELYQLWQTAYALREAGSKRRPSTS